jgi:hypothetical protein
MCGLFRRLSAAQKDTVWRNYGVFTLLISAGCALGAFQTLSYTMQVPEQLFFNNSKFLDRSASEAEQQTHADAWGLRFRLKAVEYALFGPSFILLTTAKLIALKRMVDFFRLRFSTATNRRILVAERVGLAVAAAVALLICCGCSACVYYASQVAWLDFKTARALQMIPQRQAAVATFQVAQSVVAYVEVAVLVRFFFPFPFVCSCSARASALFSFTSH